MWYLFISSVIFQHELCTCVVYSKFTNSTNNIRLEEFNTQNRHLILCSESLLRICILLDLTGASNGIGMSAYELNVRASACSPVLCFLRPPTGTASGSCARAELAYSHSRSTLSCTCTCTLYIVHSVHCVHTVQCYRVQYSEYTTVRVCRRLGVLYYECGFEHGACVYVQGMLVLMLLAWFFVPVYMASGVRSTAHFCSTTLTWTALVN